MPDDVVRDHYEQLAASYRDYLSYDGEFVPTLARHMVRMLDLDVDDRLVDLGGGTGIYTAAILAEMPLRHPVILVDPIPAMLDHVPAGLPVEKVVAGAVEFAAATAFDYDKVLMKEAVHHVEDRAALFGHLFERLPPGGRLLLVHVPPAVDYPVFEAARRRALTWHADPDHLEATLRAAGFKVERERVEYRHALPKERYFEMVGRRYMSVLSTFEDDELAAGLREMEASHAGVDVLEFSDRFDFLAGQRP